MCVQDAESREYYQMFDTRWEDMKKYKKEFLKVVQRQMFQHGHQMFIQNVETEVEEMFWADPNIHILHQQFAAKYIAGFEVRGAIRKRLGMALGHSRVRRVHVWLRREFGSFSSATRTAGPAASWRPTSSSSRPSSRTRGAGSKSAQSECRLCGLAFPSPRPSGTCFLRPSTRLPARLSSAERASA